MWKNTFLTLILILYVLSAVSSPVDTIKVEEWIKDNLIEIKSVKSIPDNSDLDKILPLFNDKRIIGLGDATHGTKEFFKLKQRLIECLIKNSNCTAIALEMPIDYGYHINHYVKTGEGDIDELLNDAWWWHGSVDIRNFLIELKEYNKNLPANKKVSFYGFDSQISGDNTYQIFEYFKKVEDEYTTLVKPFFDFMAEIYINEYGNLSPYRLNKYDQIVEKLKNLLDENESKYIKKSSREDFIFMKARINTFAGLISSLKDGSTYLSHAKIRAETNVENINIFSEIEGENNKIVVWAHNGHVTADDYTFQEFFNFTINDGFYEINTMPKENLEGYLLKQTFGDKYYNIGFEFYKGGFTAIEYQEGIRMFEVTAPEKGTFPELLNNSRNNSDFYFIELNPNKMDNNVLTYFNSKQYFHEIGAAYISRYVIKVPLTSYNAIIFINETSATELID